MKKKKHLLSKIKRKNTTYTKQKKKFKKILKINKRKKTIKK